MTQIEMLNQMNRQIVLELDSARESGTVAEFLKAQEENGIDIMPFIDLSDKMEGEIDEQAAQGASILGEILMARLELDVSTIEDYRDSGGEFPQEAVTRLLGLLDCRSVAEYQGLYYESLVETGDVAGSGGSSPVL